MAFHSFDGFDLAASPYGARYEGATRHHTAPRTTAVALYGSRPGGRVTANRPGVAKVVFPGEILSSSAAQLDTDRAALLNVLQRPRKRLISNHVDQRYWIATLTDDGYTAEADGPLCERYTATFTVEDPYARNPTPAGDVRTASLALAPGETTLYRQQFAVTPGGSASAPLVAILTNQSGGVTPKAWGLSNLTTGAELAAGGQAAVRCLTNVSVAAGGALILDGTRGELWSGALTNVAGWWPLDDASGSLLDFSGGSRDLTANGSPLYRQDGDVYGGAIDCGNNTTAFFSSASATFGFTGSFTAWLWVKPTSLGASNGYMSKSSNLNGWGIRKNSSDQLSVFVSNGSATRSATSTTTLVAGVWSFVGLRWTSTTNTIDAFINGVLDGQTGGAAFTPTAGGNDFRLGAAHNGSGAAEATNAVIAGRPGAVATAFTDAQMLALYERHLLAVLGTPGQLAGRLPGLDPTVATTNTLELRADSTSGTPSIRSSLYWLPRWA